MDTADRSTPAGRPRPVESIVDALAGRGPAVVALSGGVDSAVVASLAARALRSGVTAVTLTGAAVTSAEVAAAARSAAAAGLPHVTLTVDPVGDAEYRRNDADRCYYCRRGETAAIRAWGEDRGVRLYLDGVHLDDLGEARAGLRAMNDAGFVHPLADAGWHKSEVRAYARAVGLWNWDRPSDACLASRVARGRPIDASLLARIASAEAWLTERGFRRVRVRTDGTAARVEVDAAEVPRLIEEPFASTAIAALEHRGFGPVTLDLVGYRPRPGA